MIGIGGDLTFEFDWITDESRAVALNNTLNNTDSIKLLAMG